ncbi:MAG: PD-(D/E)XK motif protein [Deltaproteobacteria bacterium]|nr:MAG: PD-(D/E)XK motif protein [Deltaproteobacteria bacterium]
MTKENLIERWQEIPQHGMGIRTIRIDGICIPELYIGKNDAGNKCLVLYDANTQSKLRNSNMENISFEYDDVNGAFVLLLKNDYFNSLFDDLVLSIYNALKPIEEREHSTQMFLTAMSKWFEIFRRGRNEIMSEEKIRGLIAELIVLDDLMEDANPQNINEIVESWKGPDKKRHDFEMESEHIEVKSKKSDALKVKISSEFQLQEPEGMGLKLIVVSIDQNPEGDVSIPYLFESIRNRITQNLGDLTDFYDKLVQMNLNPVDLSPYQGYLYSVSEVVKFDVLLHEGFPRIVPPMLGEGISGVSYSLNIGEIDEFLISRDEY